MSPCDHGWSEWDSFACNGRRHARLMLGLRERVGPMRSQFVTPGLDTEQGRAADGRSEQAPPARTGYPTAALRPHDT